MTHRQFHVHDISDPRDTSRPTHDCATVDECEQKIRELGPGRYRIFWSVTNSGHVKDVVVDDDGRSRERL